MPVESAPGNRERVHGFMNAPAAERQLRLRFIRLGFIVVFACIGIRLIQLQVDPDLKLSKNDLNHIGTVQLRIPRGAILDSEHRLLATDRLAPSIWVDPRKVTNSAGLASRLSSILNMSEAELREKISKQDDAGARKKFVWVKRWVTDAEVQALGDLVDGPDSALFIQMESMRFYPQKELAANVLGFVNREGVGSSGVELSYDKYLRSLPGEHTARVDARRQMLSSLTLEYKKPQGGDDIYLTLDSAIQHSLERELDRAIIDAKAARAMGLIMNPNTGAILALACRPSFDPNVFSDYDPELHKNRAVIDVFEPGSAFKIVTAAASLECGLVTPGTLVNCHNGGYNFYGHRISDYHALGVEPFRTCFAQSSNVAMITVASWLGPDRLAEWIRRFGFGTKTSSDFSSESKGIYRQKSEWTKHSMAALPMGQEIAVTMPQLAVAFSVIANGGYMVEPFLVDRAVDPEGIEAYRHPYNSPQRILSPATAKTMRDLMHYVVTEGTGQYANIDRYRVAGKTGTAQMALPTGGYSKDKYTAIFAGFAPVSNPALCAVIVVQEPAIKLHFGGYICGPIFKKVVEEALVRMGWPEEPVEDEALASATPELAADADTVTARLSLAPMDAPIEAISIAPDGMELVCVDADSTQEAPLLPDFAGMTKRQAYNRLTSLGLRWDMVGSGWVVAQDPPASTPLSEVSLCRLVFANKTEINTQRLEDEKPADHASGGDKTKNRVKNTDKESDKTEVRETLPEKKKANEVESIRTASRV